MCQLLRRRPRQGNQALFAGLYLKGEVFGIDAALGEAARQEPKAGLSGALEHVAKLLPVAKAPDRPDTIGHAVAEQSAYQVSLVPVARSKDDEIRA